jgi:hypothetical protein
MNKTLVSFLKIGNAVAKQIVPSIGIAEAAIIGLKRGGDRKADVVALIKAIPEIAEAISNKDLDEAAFNQGIDKIVDGYADVLNACKPA